MSFPITIEDIYALFKASSEQFDRRYYQSYHAHGAVAGIEINEGIDRYAYQKPEFDIR